MPAGTCRPSRLSRRRQAPRRRKKRPFGEHPGGTGYPIRLPVKREESVHRRENHPKGCTAQGIGCTVPAPTPALGGQLTTDRIVQAAIELPPPRDPAPVVEVERSDTRAVVTLYGDLDLIVERQVLETIAGAIAVHGLRSLHIDATRVTFIDSSGLRSLLLSREAVLDHGLEFSLAIAATGSVARLLVLAGVHTLLVDELVTRTSLYEGPDALAG